MEQHRYGLQKYKSLKSSRGCCPGCDKKGVFTPYIDNQTGDLLSDRTGRCNREIECGYHYTPKQYFNDNGIVPEKSAYVPMPKSKPIPISYIDKSIFNKSLTGYEHNYFITYLSTLVNSDTIKEAIKRYRIGTSKYWYGAVTFWYIDKLERINYGKIMVYNPETGRRDKTKHGHCAEKMEKALIKAGNPLPDWLIRYQNNETKINCLFGEHLLPTDTKKPVAIVESEKSAIIASIYLPSFIWLACGSLTNLSEKRCAALKGRKVTLFPDLNAFDKWSDKAKALGFNISSLLEDKAPDADRKVGADLADYLVRFDVNEFLSPKLPSAGAASPQQPDKGFSTIIQDKAESKNNDVAANKEFVSICSRTNDNELANGPQVVKFMISLNVLELRQYYQDLEDHNLIPEQLRSHIRSLWDGVRIYLKNPSQLKLYTEQLESLRGEIESLNKQQIAI